MGAIFTEENTAQAPSFILLQTLPVLRTCMTKQKPQKYIEMNSGRGAYPMLYLARSDWRTCGRKKDGEGPDRTGQDRTGQDRAGGDVASGGVGTGARPCMRG